MEIEKVEVNTRLKNILAVVKIVKNLLVLGGFDLKTIEANNNSLNIYALIEIIIDDYDLEKKSYGNVSMEIMKAISMLTGLKVEDIAEFDFLEFEKVLYKIYFKFKEASVSSSFLKLLIPSINTIKE